jgi:hypothetical protein
MPAFIFDIDIGKVADKTSRRNNSAIFWRGF